MTALFSTRRRAEEFAAAMDAAVDGRRAGGSDLNAELRELVGVATTLRSHVETQVDAVPRAEFAADLRGRLLAEAEDVLGAGNVQLLLPGRTHRPRERRLAVAAASVVLVGGTASMAAAAQQALPGEALYPLKRGIEQAQAGLSVSPAGKGQDLLHQANDRLAEVKGLLADGSLTGEPQIPSTLDDFTAQAREGSALLMRDYVETRDPDNIVAVREFTSVGIGLLQELARTAPAEAQDELATAATTLSQIDAEAAALCDTCANQFPAVEVPGMFLAAAEVQRAMSALDATRLDNSHPVEVDKRLMHKAREAARDQQGDKTSGDGAAAAPQTPQAPDAPSAPDSPKAPANPPDTGLELPGGIVSDGGDAVGGAVGGSEGGSNGSGDDGVVGELSGAIETLIPDPVQEPGLP